MSHFTGSRIVVLRTLLDGPKCWRDLLVAYYGPERSQEPATTSFSNQLKKLINLCWIEKKDGFYLITDMGKQVLQGIEPAYVAAAKSEAQIAHELKKILGR